MWAQDTFIHVLRLHQLPRWSSIHPTEFHHRSSLLTQSPPPPSFWTFFADFFFISTTKISEPAWTLHCQDIVNKLYVFMKMFCIESVLRCFFSVPTNFFWRRGVRRKITLIEGNAKCRQLQRLICKGTLRQVFICLRPRTPYPTLHTVYVYTVYVLIHTGDGGGGESWIRERVRGATVHKAWSKIPTWLTVSPVYKLW